MSGWLDSDMVPWIILKKNKYFSYSARSIIFLNFISFLTINRSSLTSNWTASSGLRSRTAFCVTWFCNYEYDAVRKASYGLKSENVLSWLPLSLSALTTVLPFRRRETLKMEFKIIFYCLDDWEGITQPRDCFFRLTWPCRCPAWGRSMRRSRRRGGRRGRTRTSAGSWRSRSGPE